MLQKSFDLSRSTNWPLDYETEKCFFMLRLA